MGKMRNANCGTIVIGPQVRPRDCRYSTVYRKPCVASAVVQNATFHIRFVHVTVILICHLKNKGQLCVIRFSFRILHVVKYLKAFILRFTRLVDCYVVTGRYSRPLASPAMGHWGTCPPPLELGHVKKIWQFLR